MPLLPTLYNPGDRWLIKPDGIWAIDPATGKWRIGTAGDKCCCPTACCLSPYPTCTPEQVKVVFSGVDIYSGTTTCLCGGDSRTAVITKSGTLDGTYYLPKTICYSSVTAYGLVVNPSPVSLNISMAYNCIDKDGSPPCGGALGYLKIILMFSSYFNKWNLYVYLTKDGSEYYSCTFDTHLFYKQITPPVCEPFVASNRYTSASCISGDGGEGNLGYNGTATITCESNPAP